MESYNYFSGWEPFAEKRAEQENNFTANAVKFINSLLMSDTYLLPDKLDVFRAFVKTALRFKIDEYSALRVWLYESILQPPTEKTTDSLIEASNHISYETVDNLIEYAILAAEKRIGYNYGHLLEIDYLVQHFALNREKYASRLDKLESEIEHVTNDKNRALLKCKLPQSIENEILAELLKRVRSLNNVIDSEDLSAEISRIEKKIESHVYKIVLIGEKGHGKSNLFNKLVGCEINPISDGTEAVFELFYSERPKYAAAWLTNDKIEVIIQQLKENKELYKAYVLEELTRKDYFNQGSVISGFKSIEDISDFICSSGKYSLAVESINIGLPLEVLKYGIALIDTPGLSVSQKNSLDMAMHETANADVIILVIHAGKFGTELQRQTVTNIIECGKIFGFIVVLTHMDEIKDDKERKKIYRDVTEWVKSLPGRGNTKDVPVFSFSGSGKDNKEEEEFNRKLYGIIDGHSSNANYLSQMEKERKSLCNSALYQTDKFINDKNFNITYGKLQPLAVQLEELTEQCASQINSNIKTILSKHKSDYDALLFEIEQYKNMIKQSIRTTANEKIESAEDYKAAWDSFYSETAKNVVHTHVREFREKACKIFEGWEKTLIELDEKIAKEIEGYVAKLQHVEEEYVQVAEYALCRDKVFEEVKSKMKKTLTIRSDNPGDITPYVSNAAMEAFPQDIPWISTGFNISFIFDKFKDKEKQKESYAKSKLEIAYNTIDQRFDVFLKEIYTVFGQLEAYIVSLIETDYAPIIRTLKLNILEIKYQAEIVNRMTHDLKAYAKDFLIN